MIYYLKLFSGFQASLKQWKASVLQVQNMHSAMPPPLLYSYTDHLEIILLCYVCVIIWWTNKVIVPPNWNIALVNNTLICHTVLYYSISYQLEMNDSKNPHCLNRLGDWSKDQDVIRQDRRGHVKSQLETNYQILKSKCIFPCWEQHSLLF